jgi:hypothetical protein
MVPIELTLKLARRWTYYQISGVTNTRRIESRRPGHTQSIEMQTLYDWLRAERLDFFEEELFELFTTDVILVQIKFKEFGI